MEERSSKGKDIPVPELSSLPPRPSEVPTEAVSQGTLCGTARHAAVSDNPKDSPLIAAAPRCGTTTSTNHPERPRGTEQLASPPATTLEHPHSSITGGPASSPASSSEVPPEEEGQIGADGNGPFPNIARTMGALAAKSPFAQMLTKRSQGHPRTPP
jgi:hypothetical protein